MINTDNLMNFLRTHRRGIRSVGVPLVVALGLLADADAATFADRLTSLLDAENVTTLVAIGTLLGLGDPVEPKA